MRSSKTKPGLTRLEIAAMAMQGELASISDIQIYNILQTRATQEKLTPYQLVARNSFEMADALLAEEKKKR